jgi:subtilisin family serine protease
MVHSRDAAGSRRGFRALAAIALAAAGILALPGGRAQAATDAPAAVRAVAGRADVVPGPGEWWFGSWSVQQKVWPLTQGAGVTVAVLDTGVQASLPDLRGVVLSGADVSAGDGAAGSRSASADTDGDIGNDGHGTAVAALIAGQGYGTGIAGIAPRARILPVKVGNTGADSVAVAAAGIRLAVRRGARVINMSFGGQVPSPRSCDPVLASAVGDALEHDVVLIAAAGDSDVLPGPMEPAACPGVLAVAGVGPGGSLWPGSTHEPYVAVAAPGEQITFAGLDGRHSTTATGTSFSSALVAGAAALIRSRYPHMPWYQVDQRLIGTAAATGPRVPSDAYGYGVVNLPEAVNAAAYPLGRSAPDPVYARFRAWLASQPRTGRTQHIQAPASQAPASQAGASQARVALDSALSAVALALVLTLRLWSRRRHAYNGRRRRNAGQRGAARQSAGQRHPATPVNREWERRTWSFGPSQDGGYGGAPWHGRPPEYGAPEPRPPGSGPAYWPNGAGGSSDGWSR